MTSYYSVAAAVVSVLSICSRFVELIWFSLSSSSADEGSSSLFRFIAFVGEDELDATWFDSGQAVVESCDFPLAEASSRILLFSSTALPEVAMVTGENDVTVTGIS